METNISEAEVASRFSDILNRVIERQEEFVVQREGDPVCRIIPAGPSRFTLAELSELLSNVPKPDSAFWDEVEAVTRTQSSVPKSPW